MSKDNNIEYCKCPICKSTVEINIKFAKENGRVFCNTCCRSFEIRIEEDDEEEEKKEESVKKPIKDDFDYWS